LNARFKRGVRGRLLKFAMDVDKNYHYED